MKHGQCNEYRLVLLRITAPVQATERKDPDTVEKVRLRTSQMMELFDKFRARFTAWLYYVGDLEGYRYLHDYINFMDHLRELENDR